MKVRLSEEALQLDPGSLIAVIDHPFASDLAGHPQEAEAMLLEPIETVPDFWHGHEALGTARQ